MKRSWRRRGRSVAVLHLFGGECDGHVVTVSKADRPDVFYAVPLLDNDKIRLAKSKEAKLAVRDRLAVLAYEYDGEEHKTEDGAAEYRYQRCPARDKAPAEEPPSL